MKPFELMQCPLHGVNLIEASAGTGKTYTLTRLFLRLILERELRGEEILIVTFTEAATEELKGRLRNTIRDTLKAITSGRQDEPLIQALIRHTKPEHLMADRLNSTLRTFDEVSVFTIHSFCRRMLQDNAFESGSLFDTELITDQSHLVQEVVDDFWRKHVYQANPMFISFLESRKNTPETLSQLLSVYLRHPDVQVIPENIVFHDMSAEENALRAAFDALKTAWHKSEPEIADILYKYPGLNRRTYTEKSISRLTDQIKRYLAAPVPGINLADRFDLLTTSKLQESVKKNCAPPDHSFFALCDTLSNSYDTLKQRIEQNFIFLKTAIFSYTKTELPKKKREKNVYFFDDLLLNLRAALRHEGSLDGGALGQQIRRKYKAALIDEFQDTDPVQWEIFKTVFAHKDSALFLIGDPKQAIYGFRGADVFTYINAAQSSVPYGYTLLTNYRSEPALIQAVNTLFKGIPAPFVFEEIPFYPVSAQEGAQKESLTINGVKEPPLRLWALLHEDNDNQDKPISKELARNRTARAVAGEIERLTDPSAQVMIGSKPLQPGHIAVIVRKHSEARLIQAQLIDRNIPCVLDSQENLFDTQEAAELERVLEAVLKPGQIDLIRSSLAATILGGQADALDALFNEQSKWEEVMIQFRQFRHLWETFGFMRCFRQILSDFKVRQRLLAY
ncbi:MAG TPA: UvrD-helicase domain-containing protein, partial [Thermodesulfovibrionia bacterium]|nr:UvrD-helicase domain-containing protein [Thermodesulfovibrionia bacterium]